MNGLDFCDRMFQINIRDSSDLDKGICVVQNQLVEIVLKAGNQQLSATDIRACRTYELFVPNLNDFALYFNIKLNLVVKNASKLVS